MVLGCYYLTLDAPRATKGEEPRMLRPTTTRSTARPTTWASSTCTIAAAQFRARTSQSHRHDAWAASSSTRCCRRGARASMQPASCDQQARSREHRHASCYRHATATRSPRRSSTRSRRSASASRPSRGMTDRDRRHHGAAQRRREMIEAAEKRSREIERQFQRGLITDDERYEQVDRDLDRARRRTSPRP